MNKISFGDHPSNFLGVCGVLRQSLELFDEAEENGGLSREYSMARTKIQEAYMWMKQSKREEIKRERRG